MCVDLCRVFGRLRVALTPFAHHDAAGVQRGDKHAPFTGLPIPAMRGPPLLCLSIPPLRESALTAPTVAADAQGLVRRHSSYWMVFRPLRRRTGDGRSLGACSFFSVSFFSPH